MGLENPNHCQCCQICKTNVQYLLSLDHKLVDAGRSELLSRMTLHKKEELKLCCTSSA